MATTREDLRAWLDEGKPKGATHMIVVCDTFDHEDYPVYVMPGEDVKVERNKYSNTDQMSRVMEIYSYGHDLEEQLATPRNFRVD